MRHTDAANIAIEVVNNIKALSDAIHVAGSVRRYKPDVKDIEIVALVRKTNRNKLFYFMNQICDLKKGTAGGRYMQWQHKASGIMIDLFLPTESDYFRQFAIRTGSAEYTARVIAGGWVKLGWVGTDDGLRRRTQCIKKGNKWICTEQAPELPPVWKSEQEFFNWLGVKWVEPKERGL